MKNTNSSAIILLISTVFCGILLSSTTVKADEVVDYVALFVPSACTMSGAINSGEEHSADLQNGLYREDVGKTILSLICNDSDGFSVYAVGDTNNEYGNTVLSSHTLDSTFDIITGTATSGETSNWSMKLSPQAESSQALSILGGYSDYSAVPTAYTKVATSNSAAGIDSQVASMYTTYAVYINKTQPADTYSGQVKYTLVHPSDEIPPEPHDTEPGLIGYYPNTNVYHGSMGTQAINSTDTSTTLLASNFTRDGYGFAGWNTSYDYSGTFYGPNETISFEAGQYTDGDKGLSLYAVWIKSEGNLQNWTGCEYLSPASYNATTGTLNADLTSVTALTDLRDNQTYAIAKLADGNCWMAENLRLSSESTRGDGPLQFSQGYAKSTIYGSFVGLADSETSTFYNSTSSNSIYSTEDSSKEIQIGTSDNPGYRIPRYNNNNTANYSINPNNGNNSLQGYGNYYNWSATMASTKYYVSGFIDNDQEYDQSNLANTSLCPAGWRLPYGSDVRGYTYDGDLAQLDIEMGGTGLAGSTNSISGLSMSYYWRKFPNNLVYSGSISNSSIDSRGSNGYLWTTTASDYERSYGLSVNETFINPGVNTYTKDNGFSIRCIIND